MFLIYYIYVYILLDFLLGVVVVARFDYYDSSKERGLMQTDKCLCCKLYTFLLFFVCLFFFFLFSFTHPYHFIHILTTAYYYKYSFFLLAIVQRNNVPSSAVLSEDLPSFRSATCSLYLPQYAINQETLL